MTITWHAPAQTPAASSPAKDSDPNDARSADRAASFTVNLIAFSGATPATWTPNPLKTLSGHVPLNIVHERSR